MPRSLLVRPGAVDDLKITPADMWSSHIPSRKSTDIDSKFTVTGRITNKLAKRERIFRLQSFWFKFTL